MRLALPVLIFQRPGEKRSEAKLDVRCVEEKRDCGKGKRRV